jgi:uncharacterized protein YegP (UPF0339 family)
MKRGFSMVARYQVYKDIAGKFRFRLKAENDRIVAVSQAYEQHAGCMNGVKSVQNNCSVEIEDLTAEGKRISNPKYQVFYDKACGYRFHLNARNGEIIAASEGYETKDSCLNGIRAVQVSCDAEIEDLTGIQKPAPAEPAMGEAAGATAGAVELEMPMSAGTAEIKLELYKLPDIVAKGDVVFFKGKLSKGDMGIPKVKVRIFEHDRSFMLDAAWADGYTSEDGSFNLGVKVVPPHFWDDSAQVYAQADEDKEIKHLRSDIQKITIK